MAGVYKPSGRKIYMMTFKDQHGKIAVRSTGYHDKRCAEQLAGFVEKDAERIRAGMQPLWPKETLRFLGGEMDENTPLCREFGDAAAEYLNHLERHGTPAESTHYREVGRKLKTIGEKCGFGTLLSVRADRFAEFLSSLASAGRAPRTQNSYQETLRAFLNWCVRPQCWLESNPIAGMKMVKVGAAGRKRLRRAFTMEEFQRLVAVAPEPRRTVYLVAALSGFRRAELERMEKQDFSPIGPHPRWHVRAEVTKNGRPADLPMLPECGDVLRPLWDRLSAATDRIFIDAHERSMVPHIVTLHEDMLAAGIARQDSRGRWADFHSLRYFFCTQMGNIYPIQKVSVLMRHSTIRLTADLYTDLGITDAAESCWHLEPLWPHGFVIAGPKAANGASAGASADDFEEEGENEDVA